MEEKFVGLPEPARRKVSDDAEVSRLDAGAGPQNEKACCSSYPRRHLFSKVDRSLSCLR